MELASMISLQKNHAVVFSNLIFAGLIFCFFCIKTKEKEDNKKRVVGFPFCNKYFHWF
jgi:hypothetical protein